jgi:hypothetical protein
MKWFISRGQGYGAQAERYIRTVAKALANLRGCGIRLGWRSGDEDKNPPVFPRLSGFSHAGTMPMRTRRQANFCLKEIFNKIMNLKIKILKDRENNFNLMVSPYNPQFVEKIKTIKGHRWHPEGRYWSFPNSNGTLEKILEVFEGEKIYIDPAIQFEDLRKELVSRKYSYKTVKAYIYFNRDFLNFIHKKPLDVNDNDIKEYLAYLSEKKRASTLH